MSLAYISIIALLVAALNLGAESAILRNAQNDRPKLADKFKRSGIFLVAWSVVFFGVGCWFHFYPCKYMDPVLYLSLATAIGIPGCLIVIKGIILKGNQPKKLGQYLRLWVLIMAIIAVVLLARAVVLSLINL